MCQTCWHASVVTPISPRAACAAGLPLSAGSMPHGHAQFLSSLPVNAQWDLWPTPRHTPNSGARRVATAETPNAECARCLMRAPVISGCCSTTQSDSVRIHSRRSSDRATVRVRWRSAGGVRRKLPPRARTDATPRWGAAVPALTHRGRLIGPAITPRARHAHPRLRKIALVFGSSGPTAASMSLWARSKRPDAMSARPRAR